MYSKGARLGAVTNGENWLVLERDVDNNTIEATFQPGKTEAGTSNALNIMLAVSLSAVPPPVDPA